MCVSDWHASDTAERSASLYTAGMQLLRSRVRYDTRRPRRRARPPHTFIRYPSSRGSAGLPPRYVAAEIKGLNS
eukprot:SAG31_NODE_2658_length_5286_cov_2.941585_1_plen_74_part_00